MIMEDCGMKFVRTKGFVVVLIGVLLLNAAHADSGSQKQTLPRSVGPLTLGMTEEAFKKITIVSIVSAN